MLRFAIFLLACGISQADQVLINPGFESGSLTPWTNDTRYGTGIDWAVTSTGCHSGSFCAVDNGDIGLEETFSPVPVSSITAINGWTLAFGVGELAGNLFYVGGGETGFDVPTGSTWTYFDVLSDLRGTGELDGFELFGDTLNVAMADDFNITATAGVPEPATLGLLLAGLGAIMAHGARPKRSGAGTKRVAQ